MPDHHDRCPARHDPDLEPDLCPWCHEPVDCQQPSPACGTVGPGVVVTPLRTVRPRSQGGAGGMA